MKLLIDYQENTEGRDFVVGDIHGMYDLLLKELEKISFDKTKDRLFSVGDLVDRGPKCLETLRLIKEPWFFAVRGNHEDMFIGALAGKEFAVVKVSKESYMINYGEWITENNIEELRKLALYLIDEVPIAMRVKVSGKWVNITHAAPLRFLTDNAVGNSLQNLIWDREEIMTYFFLTGKGAWDNRYKDYPISVHGHTPLNRPLKVDSKVNWIDSGAFYTNKLTIINMKDLV